MSWSLVTATWALYPCRNPRRVGMIRDCGSVVFATTLGSSFGRRAGCSAAALLRAASALRTTRRARATRVLSSIGTGGRPIGLLPRRDQRCVPVELGLMAGDLPGQVRACLGQPVRAVRDPPDAPAAPAPSGAAAPTQPPLVPRSTRARRCCLSPQLAARPAGSARARRVRSPQARPGHGPAGIDSSCTAAASSARSVSVRVGDHLRDVLVEPFPCRGWRRSRRSPRSSSRRSRPCRTGPARPRSDHQHLREQVGERLVAPQRGTWRSWCGPGRPGRTAPGTPRR